MTGEHRILLSVDDPEVATEIERELRASLPLAAIATATDRASFEAAIAQCPPRVVVCAPRPAAFDAIEAMALLRRASLAVPVIVVSGPIGAEAAVAYMKAGAADVLLRESIPRLSEVVLAVLARGRVTDIPAPPEGPTQARTAPHPGAGDEVFRRIFEISPVAMLLVDPDTEAVLEANAAVAALYGTTREKLVGKPYYTLTGDLDRGLEPALYSVPPGTHVVTPADHRHSDRSVLELEIAATPVDFLGTPAMLCALRPVGKPSVPGPDIPMPPAVASDLVGGFVGEVGALLNNMRGYADELMVQIAALYGDPVGARELGDQIKRGDLLLRQLRMLEGHEVPVLERFDLNEMIGTADLLLAPVLRPEIALALEPATGELWLEADRSQVEMALACLVSSSVNAMSDGGRIVVRSGALSDQLAWFAVEDEGAPIQQDCLFLLFEPFQDASLLGRRTGLELAAFKRVIDELGGQVEVSGGAYRGMSVMAIVPRAT